MDSIERYVKPPKLEILQRVEDVAQKLSYPLDITTSQRTLGPRPNEEVPPQGCEIFVSKLPRQIFEDKLVPLFASIGEIYKFRLMISPSGLSNRGIAYITYKDNETTMRAIRAFDKFELEPGIQIDVAQSLDNRRIFIGGIPENKNKDQVWRELQRIGMKGILEVIMYRSYIDRNKNRGFVFVEFSTHEEAARVRLDYRSSFIFGNRVQIDWSSPQPCIDEAVMQRVKKLFVRNLNVLQEKREFEEIIRKLVGPDTVEKVYKCRDYGFIHFVSRRDAQRGLTLLREFFKHSDIEVTWAKPAPEKQQPAIKKEHYKYRPIKSTVENRIATLDSYGSIPMLPEASLMWTSPVSPNIVCDTLLCSNCQCHMYNYSALGNSGLANSIDFSSLKF